MNKHRSTVIIGSRTTSRIIDVLASSLSPIYEMLVDDFNAQVTVKNLIAHSPETRLKNFIDRVMEIT